MTRQERIAGANRRTINVADMREDARALLGWQELTAAQAADFIHVNKRSWQRFENPREHKFMQDSQIKLFWYEVALLKLEQVEEQEGQEGVEKLLGGEITVAKIFDYLHDAWERWDPVQQEPGEKS